MTWRVTHVDHHRRRRQVELQGRSRRAAEVLAELMFGAARYMAAVRVGPRS